jgi:hypothetical protein
MTETRYRPVPHDHNAFLKKARKRRGFQAAYKVLAIEYAVANEKFARMERGRLVSECAKLDPKFEKALAEEGLGQELMSWPEY